MKDVILKLLDWPFLFFGAITFLAIFFREHVKSLLNRGDIQITWGTGNSIRLRDLSDSIEKELTPLKERVDLLEAKLHKENQIGTTRGTQAQSKDDLTEKEKEVSLELMLKALESRRWTWRSLDRLALAGKVTANQAREILLDRSDSDVVFGQNKEGQTLVKLSNR